MQKTWKHYFEKSVIINIMYNLEISMAFIITELVYICLGAGWRTPPGAGISRYIEDLLVTFCCCVFFFFFFFFFFLGSGCCLFYTFPISILNSMIFTYVATDFNSLFTKYVKWNSESRMICKGTHCVNNCLPSEFHSC